LKARWKKQKEQQASSPYPPQKSQPSFQSQKNEAPAVKIQKVTPAPPPKQEFFQADAYYKKASTTPRIQNVVNALPSKRNLVLLAEILKPYEPIQ